MKKFAAITALVLSLIASGKIDLYPETGTIIDIDNDIVTVETGNGNQFAFSEADDWEIGDVVSMIMYGKGTEKVEDDEIVKVKYSGLSLK